ncbi:MAG: ATP-dependent Clp protease adaptor ClpS [Elusimicrobia bacterium]|nr:ATP-dependent Clp protease adaptor ClpS [Elusimicrobiota bacterium]
MSTEGALAGGKAALDEEETTDSDARHGWNTVLFNCDCHTFDEVERQLMKAIRCTLSTARRISWEVHSKGSAVVYSGPRERCEAVAYVLESAGLKVKVAQ